MIRPGFLFSLAASAMTVGAVAADAAPPTPPGLVLTRSRDDVASTEARARAALAKLGVPVFATFDHAANAHDAGLALRPTVVLVFGNPKVGTKLMQEQPAIALDLPLRLAIWQDEQGRTWIGYHDLKPLAAAYGIKDAETVGALAGFMGKLAAASAGDGTH
jgi:uncharacterized protein (DUF302 family)